jgi:putative SOS response-associated peptidase YedK
LLCTLRRGRRLPRRNTRYQAGATLYLGRTFTGWTTPASPGAPYREPFKKRRCLIPATGFYEPDKLNFTKSPFPWHYFQLKSRELFAFAGLYDVWTDPATNKELYSYTLITTEPNELVGQFHPRMPVLLQSKEDEGTWVNPDIVEPERLQPLLKPYPANLMEEWAVRDEARNPRNDYPELIQPIPQEAEKVEQGRLI